MNTEHWDKYCIFNSYNKPILEMRKLRFGKLEKLTSKLQRGI